MNKILSILAVFLFLGAFAQEPDIDTIIHDPQAKKILDRVSNRYQKFNTLRLYFQYQVYDNKDTTDRLKEQYTGWLFVKGQDKYKLIIPDIEIFSDGQKIYSLDKANNELNITWYDPESESVLTPQKLLYIYKQGFKYSYRGYATFDTKKAVNGKIVPQKRTMDIVDLYPEHPKESPYSLIRIWVDKNTGQLVSVKYQGKNGIDIVVDFLEEKPDINIPDIMFTYDPKRLPKDVEVNDFTEE